MFKDYYKILEVSRNATADEIKIGYRNLAKKYHPDANIPNFNFNAIMQEINEAYEVLKDDNKRKNYNSQYANELKNSFQMPKECIENENKLKSENAQLKTQLSNEIKKSADLNNRINSLTSELNNTKTELNNTKTELNNTKTELNNTKTQYANELNKTQDLNNRINSLTSELNNTKTELNNTKTQYANELNKTQDLNNRINSLTSELNNTKTQLSNEIKKSADLNNRINSLTSELNNTKTELNNTKTQLANELNKSLTSELINYLMKLFLNENKRKNYNSQYANELKNSSQNSNFIIWNGKDIKDFGVKPEGYGTYKNFVKAGFIENEFETVAESKEQLAKSGMLNAYFGIQNINMKYTADKTEFDVSINSFADFKVTVPRNIAKEFKEQVKSFDFNFDRKLKLDSISVLFNNQLFYGRDFNKDLLVEKERLEKERFTIRKNVFIDNKTGYMWEKKAVKGEFFQRFLNENINSYDELISFIQTNKNNGGFQDYWDKNTMNWHEAKNYCDNLVLDGHSDWKLPSRDEFHTLMTASYGKWDNYDNLAKWFNENRYKRNSNLFLPKELVEFFGFTAWTRDISKINTSYSWRLYFGGGNDYYYNQGDNNLFRCVR